MDTNLKERISNLSDADLEEMVGRKATEYRPDALDYAAEVLESRGIQTPLKSSSSLMTNGDSISGVSKQVSAVMHRYDDAYLVARAVNGYGIYVKAVGIIGAIILFLFGIMLFANEQGSAIGIGIIILGLFAGVWFYLVGVLISAQGQILKASLDTAVNSSPFLTNGHRAEIMSLPKA